VNRDQALQAQVIAAAAEHKRLNITAGNSKTFLGRPAQGEVLDLSAHRGILSYEPKELVITALSGTPLAEIEAALGEQGQMLPFEPPHFGPAATLGGTIACGLSGPRRPYSGSARDFVLGVRLLNGRGEILRFGGEVMKNVAGYDISRLMSGAMGTLGVMLDISLKVLPIPTREMTLVSSHTPLKALQRFSEWSGKPLPLTAAVCDGESAYIRLSGTASAVDAARQILGGEPLEDGERFWREKIREQGHAFFRGEAPLWRISVPPTTADGMFPGKCLIDWGGALRWLRTERPPDEIFAAAARAGGHATLFRGGERQGAVHQPLSPAIMGIHSRLKQAFDPQRLFNVGRMYAEI
jgi:glycolate oxidase FAD binding subunit